MVRTLLHAPSRNAFGSRYLGAGRRRPRERISSARPKARAQPAPKLDGPSVTAHEHPLSPPDSLPAWPPGPDTLEPPVELPPLPVVPPAAPPVPTAEPPVPLVPPLDVPPLPRMPPVPRAPAVPPLPPVATIPPAPSPPVPVTPPAPPVPLEPPAAPPVP